ncbi:MAG: LapA family protein [Desulfovibrio sp.]|jgi:ATP adenylyltransferase|nr:LapA family protein [Desulfovibrio sp.]
MRYLKVLLLVALIFLALIFFFQNQNALSQDLVLGLNLFFIPAMSSIPLPFYFVVITAFFLGALLALSILVWDKAHLSARLLKSRWHIGSLEREVEKLRKRLEESSTRSAFFGNTGDNSPGGTTAAVRQPEDVAAPDPDKV